MQKYTASTKSGRTSKVTMGSGELYSYFVRYILVRGGLFLTYMEVNISVGEGSSVPQNVIFSNKRGFSALDQVWKRPR